MSELKKILEEVKVEWKFLADEIYIEIANSARKPIKASLRSSGNTPYYGANNIQDYVEGKTHSGEYVLIAEDGSSNLNNYSIQYAQGDFWANNHVHVLRGINGLNTKFLFHCLKIVNFIPYLTGGERAKLTKGNLLQIQIPIPCPDNPEKSLKIQEEIVRILDSLSEETNQLTAALQKELVLHQKRYDFYREELFNPNGKEVGWKNLADLGSFTYGYAASALDSGDTRFVRITDINANGQLIQSDPKYVNLAEDNKKYLLKKDDLLMARTGATFGKTMIFTESYSAIYAGFLIRLNLDKTIILPKFYWHFAQSTIFWHQANNLVSGGGQPQFNANALKRVMVPIPYERDVVKSLAEQDRVVKILDEMDEKNQAITSAIKKEIALRNKQYEYYRDRLLSFQSLETEAEAIP